jgi:hypothetical protein
MKPPASATVGIYEDGLRDYLRASWQIATAAAGALFVGALKTRHRDRRLGRGWSAEGELVQESYVNLIPPRSTAPTSTACARA